MDFLTMALAFS